MSPSLSPSLFVVVLCCVGALETELSGFDPSDRAVEFADTSESSRVELFDGAESPAGGAESGLSMTGVVWVSFRRSPRLCRCSKVGLASGCCSRFLSDTSEVAGCSNDG
jgi:hypothetical protein